METRSNERKWTPGPWVAEPENYDGDGGVLVRVGGDYPRNCIANAWGQQSAREVDDEGQANAHLIAAAPDLYKALEECLNAEMARRKKLKDGAPASEYSDARIARIRAALAKARGGK